MLQHFLVIFLLFLLFTADHLHLFVLAGDDRVDLRLVHVNVRLRSALLLLLLLLIRAETLRRSIVASYRLRRLYLLRPRPGRRFFSTGRSHPCRQAVEAANGDANSGCLFVFLFRGSLLPSENGVT